MPASRKDPAETARSPRAGGRAGRREAGGASPSQRAAAGFQTAEKSGGPVHEGGGARARKGQPWAHAGSAAPLPWQVPFHTDPRGHRCGLQPRPPLLRNLLAGLQTPVPCSSRTGDRHQGQTASHHAEVRPAPPQSSHGAQALCSHPRGAPPNTLAKTKQRHGAEACLLRGSNSQPRTPGGAAHGSEEHPVAWEPQCTPGCGASSGSRTSSPSLLPWRTRGDSVPARWPRWLSCSGSWPGSGGSRGREPGGQKSTAQALHMPSRARTSLSWSGCAWGGDDTVCDAGGGLVPLGHLLWEPAPGREEAEAAAGEASLDCSGEPKLGVTSPRALSTAWTREHMRMPASCQCALGGPSGSTTQRSSARLGREPTARSSFSAPGRSSSRPCRGCEARQPRARSSSVSSAQTGEAHALGEHWKPSK